jgi:hypothetical protein
VNDGIIQQQQQTTITNTTRARNVAIYLGFGYEQAIAHLARKINWYSQWEYWDKFAWDSEDTDIDIRKGWTPN